MKLFKVHVKEAKPINSIYNYQYEEESIEIFEELKYEDEHFLMNEYSRENIGRCGRLLRIGVYSPEASKVFIQSEGIKTFLVQSKTIPEIWYEPTKGWIEEQHEQRSKSCFGMNACGKWTISVLEEKSTVIEETQVIVMPSTMTYSQYKTMQAEVKSLFENLVSSPEDSNFLKELQLSLFRLDDFISLIEELRVWVQQICEHPAEKLVRTREKKSRDRITKWDGPSLLEGYMFPFREHLSIPTTIKKTSLDEHRMIRYMLESMKKRIVHQRLVEKSARDHLQIEWTNRVEKIAFMDRTMRINLEKRCQSYKNDIESLERREQKWLKCLSIVDLILMEDLFNVEPLIPELTHMFTHEPSYGAVYDLYEQFEQMIPKLQPVEKEFMEAMINSPHLYEVWLLLQLVQHLRKIKLDCSGVRRSLIKKYKKDKKISGWKYKFLFKEDGGELALCYEPEILVKGEGKLRPDYLILYRPRKSEEWQGHTLDAKYKPYTKIPLNVLEHDIDHSCSRYLNKIKKGGLVMKSASLVHVDCRANNWNLDRNRVYNLSHFSVLPGDMGNIQIYLKRIFHFYGGYKELCLSCGNIAKKEDKIYKQTYMCQEDNEVWVSNICKYRKTHHFNNNQNISLMKYPSGNYNTQVKNNWDVHCPICNKDYHGNVLVLDVFGQ